MRSEWQRVQIWRPREQMPEHDPSCLLYIPVLDLDLGEIRDAIYIVEPRGILPAASGTFEQATIAAHMLRDDARYSTGVVLPPVINNLEKYITWAIQADLNPIVFTAANFYGGVNAQDKGLWQLSTTDTLKDHWYHLATDRRPEVKLPGRWTVGRPFLDTGARQ